MLFYKIISFKEGTNEVLINNLYFIVNSKLENILLGMGIINTIILILIVFNIILYFNNNIKTNKYFLFCSLLFYLIGVFINLYYLIDLNLNIKEFISEYINLHIVLFS